MSETVYMASLFFYLVSVNIWQVKSSVKNHDSDWSAKGKIVRDQILHCCRAIFPSCGWNTERQGKGPIGQCIHVSVKALSIWHQCFKLVEVQNFFSTVDLHVFRIICNDKEQNSSSYWLGGRELRRWSWITVSVRMSSHKEVCVSLVHVI